MPIDVAGIKRLVGWKQQRYKVSDLGAYDE